MIVIICDGSSKGNPGNASIGVIIWKRLDGHNQRIIRPTSRIKKDIGFRTNMEAEWESILEAMRWVRDNNSVFDDVYLYNDSLVVVRQALGEWKVKHENIIPLYHQYKLLLQLPEFKNFGIVWIPRQLVYLADKEAQKGGK